MKMIVITSISKKKNFKLRNSKILERILKSEVKRKKYTNYEVIKDMLLFLCSVGCRFGDMLNMKLDNFRFYKDEKGVEDRTKEVGNLEWKKFHQRGCYCSIK
jgi:integrase